MINMKSKLIISVLIEFRKFLEPVDFLFQTHTVRSLFSLRYLGEHDVINIFSQNVVDAIYGSYQERSVLYPTVNFVTKNKFRNIP